MAASLPTISANRRHRLVVMVKEPHPGRVKTRLGRGIGMVPAAWWFRHQCARLLRGLADPRWDTVLAVSPDAEGLASRIWPAHLGRVPQGRGDLGARMGRVFRGLPPGPVVIIGADIPGVTRAHIARGLRRAGQGGCGVRPRARWRLLADRAETHRTPAARNVPRRPLVHRPRPCRHARHDPASAHRGDGQATGCGRCRRPRRFPNDVRHPSCYLIAHDNTSK